MTVPSTTTSATSPMKRFGYGRRVDELGEKSKMKGNPSSSYVKEEPKVHLSKEGKTGFMLKL